MNGGELGGVGAGLGEQSAEQVAVETGVLACDDCSHLIAVHSHEAGCMDSMVGGLLERDRLGFCPCQKSSIDLTRHLYERVLQEAIDATHHEQRMALDAGRGEENMTLFQHWSATAGWLAWRIREFNRTGEPDWPDAMVSDPSSSPGQQGQP